MSTFLWCIKYVFSYTRRIKKEEHVCELFAEDLILILRRKMTNETKEMTNETKEKTNGVKQF